MENSRAGRGGRLSAILALSLIALAALPAFASAQTISASGDTGTLKLTRRPS